MEIRSDQAFTRAASPSPGSGVKENGVEVEAHLPKNDVDKAGKDPSMKELQDAVDSLNKFLETKTTHLKFQLHEKLQKYYVQIVDDNTDEVVKEIPSKKLLDVAAKIQEMVGILVDEKL